MMGGHTDTRFLLHWMGCAAQISNEMRRFSGGFVKSLDLRFRSPGRGFSRPNVSGLPTADVPL